MVKNKFSRHQSNFRMSYYEENSVFQLSPLIGEVDRKMERHALCVCTWKVIREVFSMGRLILKQLRQ